VLLPAQMSTGMPVEVLSAKPGQSFMSYYKLDIDIHKCARIRAVLAPN
jgi:DNA topoisomerase VI subunit B